MIIIKHKNKWSYVYRLPTHKDQMRYLRNGYICPDLVREERSAVYQYARGELKPNYPVSATLENAGVATCLNDMAVIGKHNLGMLAFQCISMDMYQVCYRD